jgi:hypothetical protein
MFNHKCTMAIYTTSKTENPFVQYQQFFRIKTDILVNICIQLNY